MSKTAPARLVVLGLGSNQGDRLETLRRSVEMLELEIVARSAVYQTDPVGPPQPRYLNAAVAVRTALRLEALLERTQDIERALGRRPSQERWGPRPIDVDILWCEGEHVATAALVVPHPRLCERSFALVPLLEVAPDARDPITGERYAGLATARAELARVGAL